MLSIEEANQMAKRFNKAGYAALYDAIVAGDPRTNFSDEPITPEELDHMKSLYDILAEMRGELEKIGVSFDSGLNIVYAMTLSQAESLAEEITFTGYTTLYDAIIEAPRDTDAEHLTKLFRILSKMREELKLRGGCFDETHKLICYPMMDSEALDIIPGYHDGLLMRDSDYYEYIKGKFWSKEIERHSSSLPMALRMCHSMQKIYGYIFSGKMLAWGGTKVSLWVNNQHCWSIRIRALAVVAQVDDKILGFALDKTIYIFVI